MPSNALIWVGLALSGFEVSGLALGIVVAVVALATDVMMVSELPLFSLKFNFKDLSWKTNSVQYLFLVGCAVLIAVLRNWIALSAIILWYILFSIITRRHHAQ